LPIKNYTTEVPADRSIGEIQAALVKHGATGVAYDFEPGGRIAALFFRLNVSGSQVQFALPVNWKLFQVVLKEQKVSRWREEDYVYRVAWRNIRDWVLAQLALYETSMVDLPQIFLPFAQGRDGRTLYEAVKEQRFLIGDGKS
jgi:hypothetical protein